MHPLKATNINGLLKKEGEQIVETDEVIPAGRPCKRSRKTMMPQSIVQSNSFRAKHGLRPCNPNERIPAPFKELTPPNLPDLLSCVFQHLET